MKLRQLRVRRMPGIDEPFTVSDVGPALNVVHGPNESGKTSLCKAVRAVLWGGADPRCSVEAVWDDEGRTRTSALDNGRLAWQVDGVDGKPDLPPAHLAGCFAVRVDELLPESDATDADIAAEIATRMRGGYSVQRVLADAAYLVPKVVHKTGLNAARSALRDAEAAQRVAAEHEAALPGLARQRDTAQEAQDHLTPLMTALDLATARSQLEAAGVELGRFPDGMDRFEAGDLTTLEDKTQLVTDAEGRLRDAEGTIATATRRIGEARLPGDRPLDEAELSEWDERTHKLAEHEQAASLEAGNEAAAKAAMRLARDALAPNAADTLPVVNRNAVADTEKLLADAMDVEAQDKALQYKLALVQAGAEARDPDALRDGAKILTDWLAVADAGPLQASRRPRLAGIALGATTILTGALAASLYQPVFWLAASIGVALLIWYLLASRRPVSGVDPEQARGERRQAYEQTGLDSPKAWDRTGVQAQLDVQLRLMKTAAEEVWKASQRSALGAEASGIATRQAQARKAREAFEGRTGIGLDPNLLQATAFVHALASYQEALGRWQEAKAKREAALQEAGRLLAAVNGFLARFPFAVAAEVTDSAAARARLADLRERSAAVGQALTEKEQAERHKTSAKKLVEQRTEDVNTFLQSRGVESEDELRRRAELLPAWQEATEKKRDAESAIRQAERNLEPFPDYRYLSQAEAEAKLQTARDEAPKLTEIIQRATEIQGEVKRVREGTSLLEARAKLQEEQASIAAKRDQALDALAGSFLLRKAEQEHAKTQPGVLDRASELFGDFTRHAYYLTVVAGDGQASTSFRAVENDTGRSKSLAELSGGTRIQLLLAVRLAFAEQAESGAKLPLFLDETLKHSDPDRYDAIAACMHGIAQGERQVFYLTNDPVDVQRLKQSVPDPGLVHVIDLAECRRLGRRLGQTDIAVPPRLQVPPPDGLTPDQYGSLLAVPPPQPLDGPEQTALFWLLRRDLPLLHKLLCADIGTVGRWRSLRDRGRERLGLASEDVARLDALSSMAEAFAASWCVGRCRRVTRDVLSGAGVSNVFIDRVWKRARELGCDARKLMDVLKGTSDRSIKGFHTKACATVEENLRTEGFLSEDEALDEDGIRLEVLGAPGVDALGATEIMDCVHDLFAGASMLAGPASWGAG